jgi:uncharacterized protein with HEPN domain
MRSDRARVQDALDAITTIEQYLPPNREAFDRDPPLQSHIYRHILIVGDAVWRISPSTKDSHPQIPWRQIEGMRHILVHDYFRVDWTIVYETATVQIPALKPALEAILRSLSAPPT